MDVLTLSRLQFAFTIAFHYLFPPLTIGLGKWETWRLSCPKGYTAGELLV